MRISDWSSDVCSSDLIPPSGLGNAAAVKAATRDQLATFHDTWIRPDNARIFVVGDTTLAEVKKELDATLGEWKSTATSKSEKNFDAAIPEPQPRIRSEEGSVGKEGVRKCKTRWWAE